MSDLPQDDIDWINDNLHLTVIVPETWEARAKKLRASRDSEAALANTRLKDAKRWVGLLAEYYTGSYFKELLEDNNKGDWQAKHDFTHKISKKRMDVKSNNGYKDYENDAYFTVLKDACDWEAYDYLILCWYGLTNRQMCIRGWVSKTAVLSEAKSFPVGANYSYFGQKEIVLSQSVFQIPSSMLTSMPRLKDLI